VSALPAEAASAYPATAPAPAGSPKPQRRAGLRVVPAPAGRGAPLAPFVAVVIGLLVAGLATLLLLNTLLAQDAFRLHDLQQSGALLAEREQALERELTALESPGSVAERAEGLGMVPTTAPLFLRLPEGEILGARPEGLEGAADRDALDALESDGELVDGNAAEDAADSATDGAVAGGVLTDSSADGAEDASP
jgi:hypothetical protein